MNTQKKPVIHIDKMVFQGYGMGRFEDKVYFIEGALEQEWVEFEVTAEHRSYNFAKATKIVQPSPYRQTSTCAYSDSCGGCPWIELKQERQVFWKRAIVEENLRKAFKDQDLQLEIKASPRSFAYRSRVTLRCHIDAAGRPHLGYFKRNSHELVAIDSCKVAAPAINAFIEGLSSKRFSASRNEKFRFEVQLLPLAADAATGGNLAAADGKGAAASGHAAAMNWQALDQSIEKSLLVQVIAAQKHSANVQEVLDAVSSLPIVRECLLSSERKRAHFPFIRIRDLILYTAPGQFQQINLELNAQLQTYVADIVAKRQPKSVVDLFSGSGNFSLALADGKRKVLGVEDNPLSIATGNYNVECNKLDKVNYVRGDVASFLPQMIKQGYQTDFIIVDPPRAGMKNLMNYLDQLSPADILYISCDPTSLARDLIDLGKGGYRAVEAQALDFFPQTYHVETVVWLQRQLQ